MNIKMNIKINKNYILVDFVLKLYIFFDFSLEVLTKIARSTKFR